MDTVFVLRIVGVVLAGVGLALLFAVWPRISRRVRTRIDREVHEALTDPRYDPSRWS